MPLIRTNTAGPETPPSGPAALPEGAAEARWTTARSLREPGDVATLSAALDAEQDARVREAILTSLTYIGTPEAGDAMIPHVRSDDAGLRTAVLDALRAMPGVVAARLPALLADPDPDVRLLACELVRCMPGPNGSQLLCDLIQRETEANVCGAAIEVLAEVGGPEALPALARCASRYPTEPFLAFAIRIATERILGQGANQLG